MRLAAMVGLMIEEVRQDLCHLRPHRVAGHRAIDEILFEARRRNRIDKRNDAIVHGDARSLQRGEVGVQNLVEAGDAGAGAVEPPQPHLVADQDVIERLQQRGKDAGARGRERLGLQLAHGFVQPRVGPAVVRRHSLQMRLHGSHRHGSQAASMPGLARGGN